MITSCEFAVLELSHLVHPTDYLLFRVAILHMLLIEPSSLLLLLLLLVGFVHDLDRCHIRAVRLVKRELNIVRE